MLPSCSDGCLTFAERGSRFLHDSMVTVSSRCTCRRCSTRPAPASTRVTERALIGCCTIGNLSVADVVTDQRAGLPLLLAATCSRHTDRKPSGDVFMIIIIIIISFYFLKKKQDSTNFCLSACKET